MSASSRQEFEKHRRTAGQINRARSSSEPLKIEKNNLRDVLIEIKDQETTKHITLCGHYTADNFKTLQKKMGKVRGDWCIALQIDSIDSNLQSFISDELTKKTIHTLFIEAKSLNGIIDSIINDCINSKLYISLRILDPISDTQANELYQLLLNEKLCSLSFSGENISEETAKKFAYYKSPNEKNSFSIENSEFYDRYLGRLRTLRSIDLDKLLYEDFNPTSDELSEMITEMETYTEPYMKHPFILRFDMGCRKDFSDPLWIPFFENVIIKRSGCLMQLGNISHDVALPEVIMATILQSLEKSSNFHHIKIYGHLMKNDTKQLTQVLRTNTAIKTVIVTKEFFHTESLCELIDTIANNPQSTVSKLQIGYYDESDDVIKALKKLLMTNITLKSLALTYAQGRPFFQLVEGLENNKTLQSLELGGNGITCQELILIGKCIEKNNTLTSLVLPHLNLIINEQPWPALTQFLKSSQVNTTLQELRLSLSHPDSRTHEPTKQVLHHYLSEIKNCTDRNKEIYQRDQAMAIDEYFLTASVLFQAVRTHPNHFKTDICFIILSMLAPPIEKQDKLSTAINLIENNINTRRWKSDIDVESWWGLDKITLFKRWEKSDESRIAAYRAERLGCKF